MRRDGLAPLEPGARALRGITLREAAARGYSGSGASEEARLAGGGVEDADAETGGGWKGLHLWPSAPAPLGLGLQWRGGDEAEAVAGLVVARRRGEGIEADTGGSAVEADRRWRRGGAAVDDRARRRRRRRWSTIGRRSKGRGGTEH